MKQTLCIRYNDSYCTYLFIFLMEAGMDFYQDSLPENRAIKILVLFERISTGCDSHFRNPVVFNILKEPLLVQKQTLHQQKVLDLSFDLAP